MASHFAGNWGHAWLKRLREKPQTLNRLKAIRYYTNLFRATPRWLTEEHRLKMRKIYRDARARGLHVDHIVPLSSSIVCGLHVPWNLQAREARRNYEKSNKWWPGCPFEQGTLEFKSKQLELLDGKGNHDTV